MFRRTMRIVVRCRAAIPLALLGAFALPAAAQDARTGKGGFRECVPFARQLSGIDIHGNAATWWKQARGRYERGHMPRPGAVLVLPPHGGSRLGHVAVVSRIVDVRTILISHANWSPVDGRRGQVERDVAVLDVSPANDWSKVRVWYGPARNLGTTRWPVSGFIYPRSVSERAADRHSDPIGAIIRGEYRQARR